MRALLLHTFNILGAYFSQGPQLPKSLIGGGLAPLPLLERPCSQGREKMGHKKWEKKLNFILNLNN